MKFQVSNRILEPIGKGDLIRKRGDNFTDGDDGYRIVVSGVGVSLINLKGEIVENVTQKSIERDYFLVAKNQHLVLMVDQYNLNGGE